MASSGSDPPEDLIERECEGLLLEAVQSLPPRDQVFLGLCYHQALPPQDIAGILKISVPAVYTQKSRILAKLRELLGKTRAL